MKKQATINTLLTWAEEITNLEQSGSFLYESIKGKCETFKSLNKHFIDRYYKDILKIAPKYYEHTIKENGEIEYTIKEGNPVLQEGVTQEEFEKERQEFLDTVIFIYV